MIHGVLRIPLQRFEDERGWFAELMRAGALPKPVRQSNLVFSRRGVVRGLHYHERGQDDLFACVSGMVRVVVLDRESGETFTEDIGDDNQVAIYIPGIHAHGDGLIHIHPFVTGEAGKRATVGKFLEYAGLDASSDSFTMNDGQTHKTGDECDGTPATVRWSLNGEEQGGNISSYHPKDQDVIALALLPEGEDIGAGGIRIGETTLRKEEADKTLRNAVTDNHIHDIGVAFPAGVAVWVAVIPAVPASCGLLLALGYALQTAGLERTTVSSAGFITGLYVVFTPLLGLLLFRTRVGGARRRGPPQRRQAGAQGDGQARPGARGGAVDGPLDHHLGALDGADRDGVGDVLGYAALVGGHHGQA